MGQRKRFNMDFVIKSSPTILYNFLSTPSGLAQWFADHVDRTENDYSFFWEGFEEKAILLEFEENSYVRFKMLENDDDDYFEFKIEKSPITGDTILIITDHADDIDLEDQMRLWTSQVATLTGRVGGAN